jgi:hypothetical protein
VEVEGHLHLQEITHCFPRLVVIVVMVQLWQRGAVEEVLMVGQEAQMGLQDTQTQELTMVEQQGGVDTLAMEVAYMMEGQGQTTMELPGDLPLLVAWQELEDIVLLLVAQQVVDLVVVVQETMLEEEVVGTVEVMLVYLVQPIDVEGWRGLI